MPIWEYRDLKPVEGSDTQEQVCPYCIKPLTILLDREKTNKRYVDPELTWNITRGLRVASCSICGWWKTWGNRSDNPLSSQLTKGSSVTYGAIAQLKQLNTRDLSIPLNEIRTYLCARYDSRFLIHPRLLEETVASVFASLGYDVIVTGYAGDDGIDVIIYDESGEIGVQVKRYRSSIEVSQIRELAGALVFRGVTRGIFVTTSSFQKGAQRTVDRYFQQGIRIELVDALRFFDALKITQIPPYSSFADFQRHHRLKLTKLPILHAAVAY